MIWRNGRLPPGSPSFAPSLTEDLLGYGFSLIRLALRLRELRGNPGLARRAFESAAESIEATVRNGRPALRERGFYRICAAAAYHLAGYSARTYSLMRDHLQGTNLSPIESALALLMLRSLDQMRLHVRSWLEAEHNSDAAVRNRLADLGGDFDVDDAFVVALTANFYRALAVFDHALRTGDIGLKELAVSMMERGANTADRRGFVPIWWVSALAKHFLDDLWGHSLHERLPRDGDHDGEGYNNLRQLFIKVLYTRSTAEIELWPSQIEAAERAMNISDDLVCALPTSAGKTRIAEIAILRTLSLGHRVLVVTPLRSLSAQTEHSLRAIFAPLGFTISSLYGAAGATDGDIDTLSNRDVVIATPEKLDFALRNASHLIDDVGLVVLDEGHLIGPNQREIRYEVLVQRLLRRSDASGRRIVCLSAILPDGQELEEFVAWLRQDEEGGPVKSDWRPTRQRFGEILWRGNHARLDMNVDRESTFISRFVVTQPPAPKTRRRNPFPQNQQELVLAAAWKLVEDGQRVLIYCAERRSVEPLAECILTLKRQKLLASLLHGSDDDLHEAEAIGREWLGPDHPAVRCLRMGVAVHHAKLPRPFLRAVEGLLKRGVLVVTISSPTLAQGVNLSAGTLLVPSIYRNKAVISGEEFANVAGRAGRAYVDIDGQILHVLFEPDEYKLRKWKGLVQATKTRNIESGLFTLVAQLIRQLDPEGLARTDVVEYLASNAGAWRRAIDEAGAPAIEELLDSLDAALLALIDPLGCPADEIPALLDRALQQSLWSRRLARLDEEGQRLHQAILFGRAGLIWSATTGRQREGYFRAGLGAETGLFLDANAKQLNTLLATADSSVMSGDADTLVMALADFAKIVFQMQPFQPKNIPGDWQKILEGWLTGRTVQSLLTASGALGAAFIEDALVYRLVWALEAVRVRGLVHRDEHSENFSGRSAIAVESGMANISAALLIQAGLSSRIAALKAVTDAAGTFMTPSGIRDWLSSAPVEVLSEMEEWPTLDTANLWRKFRRVNQRDSAVWSSREGALRVIWHRGAPPTVSPEQLHLVHDDGGPTWVYTASMERLGRLKVAFPHRPAGVMSVVRIDRDHLRVRYTGPQNEVDII